ncbi:MAG: VWA domain-containing protein, partial [Planctomycetota bacterium]
MPTASPTLASLIVGPVQFDTPIWLILAPVLWALAIIIGRKSLSDLSGASRKAALVIRLIVIALLVAALAEPSTRDESKSVAVTVILDASRSVPIESRAAVDEYVELASQGDRREGDKLGHITAAKNALVQTLPSQRAEILERRSLGATDGTNLADAVQLGIATASQDAAQRFVLASDGNETEGDLLRAAQAARAARIPIDVFPIEYIYESEVVVDRVDVPPVARLGETINLVVKVTATRPTSGRINILLNDQPLDLDPDSPAFGVERALTRGDNFLTVPVPVIDDGALRFEAVYEPTIGGSTTPVGDSIGENNRALGVTFVTGEGRVLVVRNADTEVDESALLVRAVRDAEISCTVVSTAEAPTDLAGFNAYDAVILVNQEAFGFSQTQQEAMRQYVHDAGGGLVMIGGDRAFGAGGWIGSPVEETLPIRLDPPSKRQLPRGALAIIVHSVEIPQGVFYGKQVANAAVDALSRLDFVGIIELNWQTGMDFALPMQLKGDGAAAKRAIERLTFGDMQNFDPSLQLALSGLQGVNAGQRHTIVISDGDPSLSRGILRQFAAAGITISAVGVNPHSRRDLRTLQDMATITGGRFYEVRNNQLATLPQIFTKEARTIKRSLIWEGDPFSPAVSSSTETLRGIGGVPPITGYVVTA